MEKEQWEHKSPCNEYHVFFLSSIKRKWKNTENIGGSLLQMYLQQLLFSLWSENRRLIKNCHPKENTRRTSTFYMWKPWSPGTAVCCCADVEVVPQLWSSFLQLEAVKIGTAALPVTLFNVCFCLLTAAMVLLGWIFDNLFHVNVAFSFLSWNCSPVLQG